MMCYKEYKEFVLEVLKEKTGEDAELSIMEAVRINDRRTEAIQVENKKGVSSILIYLDGLYAEYLRTGNPYAWVEQCDAAFADTKAEQARGLFMDWESVRPHVRIRLVGRERNREYLKDKVYKEILDLAMLVTIILQEEQDGAATIPVTRKLMAQCGFDEEALFAAAEENLQKEEIHIWGMGELICSVLEEPEEAMCMDVENLQETMYVISNEQKTFGARALCRKDMLGRFAEKLNRNLYIIPSSLHELILLKDEGEIDDGYMREIVYDVNHDRNAVRIEDVLSDSLYYYDRRTGEVRIVE